MHMEVLVDLPLLLVARCGLEHLADGVHAYQHSQQAETGSQRIESKGKTLGTVDLVQTDSAEHHAEDSRKQAGIDVLATQGCNQSQGEQRHAEVLPRSELERRRRQWRRNENHGEHANEVADDGGEHTRAKRFARQAFLCHRSTVKASCDGTRSPRNIQENCRNQSTGHTADIDGCQHGKSHFLAHHIGNRQEHGQTRDRSQARKGTKDDTDEHANEHRQQDAGIPYNRQHTLTK